MKLRVTATVLNLRSGPSAESRIVGQVVKGVEVESVDTGPWRLVRTAGSAEGWVHGDYVTEATAETSTATKWRVAKSLDQLLAQIDKRAPKRNKAYDGSIGDSSHAARQSDHNPDSNGVVLARDFTHDPAQGMDAETVAETLRISQDRRIAYVIHSGRIFSATSQPWKWRPYKGTDAHAHHMHVSVVRDPKGYDDLRPWAI